MAQVTITVTLASAGTDAGPFDITDNLGNTLATGVTKAELLAGYVIPGVDSSVTQITVCSTGTCTNCRSVDVTLTPSLGNCISYRFTLSSKPDSGCRTYTVQLEPDVEDSTTFTARACGATSDTTYTLRRTGPTSLRLCLESPPAGSGINYSAGTVDCGSYSTEISYLDCEGVERTTVLTNSSPEFDVCAIENQYFVNETYVTVSNFGACTG